MNALGRSFSHSFGYGIMDATGMVDLALKWTNVPEQESYAVKANIGMFNMLSNSLLKKWLDMGRNISKTMVLVEIREMLII